MKIVIAITLLETLAVGLWLLHRSYSRYLRSKTPAVLKALIPTADDVLSAVSPSAGSLLSREATHWAFINEWKIPAQADDRTPVNGTVVARPGTPSAQRAFARNSHQLSYKEWSANRHD